MKGTSMFGDTFLIFALIAIAILFTAFLWAVTTVYTVMGPNTRYVTMNIMDYPIENDAAFSAILEYTVDGVPVKTLVTQVAIQRKTIISYGDAGEIIDVSAKLNDILEKTYPTKRYMMMIKSPDLILAKSDTLPDTMNKVSTSIFLPGGTATLEMYLGD